jgi:chorismate mutase
MTTRGFRGATQLASDSLDEMKSAVGELVLEILRANKLETESLVSILFTGTPDIHSAFPATAIRDMGFEQVPLICAQEMEIPGALPLTVRVLIHANSELPQKDVVHVYQRGAIALRPDLAR